MSLLLVGDPFQPGLFTHPFRLECEKGVPGKGASGTPELYVLLELHLPSNTWRISSSGLGSVATGGSFNWVRSWGRYARGIGGLRGTGTLGGSRMTIEFTDQSKALQSEWARNRNRIRGSVARVRVYSPNVTPENAFLLLDGRVEAMSFPEPYLVRVTVGPNSRPLRDGIVSPWAAKARFPNISAAHAEQYLPVVFGYHESSGLTQKGMVPCLHIDTGKYFATLGRARAIRKVYVDDVVDNTATIDYPTESGLLYTRVSFGTDKGDNVSVDMEGITDRADGTGDLLHNPALVTQWLLANVAFGRWGAGNYIDPSTLPIELTHFQRWAQYYRDLNVECSRRFGGTEQLRGEDVLREMQENFDHRLFWTNAGKVGMTVLRYDNDEPYIDDEWIRGDEEGVDLEYLPDMDAGVRHVSMQHLYDEKEGKFSQELTVSDLTVVDDVTAAYQLRWSASRII